MTAAKNSPWRDILFTTLTKFGMIPIGLATSIVITRGLSPSEKGQYSAALTVVTLVGLLSGFGVGRGLLFVLTRKSEIAPASARRTALIFAVISGGLLVLLVCLLAYSGLDSLIPGVRPILVVTAAPIIALTGLRSILEGVLRGDERNSAINLAAIVASVALLGAVAAFWAANRLDPTAALGARVASASIGLGVVAVAVNRRAENANDARFDRTILRLLLGFGLPYLLVVVTQNMNYDADILLVARYMNDAAVGQYSTAVSVAEFLWYLPMAAGFVLVPRAARHSLGEAASETARVLRITMLLTLLVCLALFLLGPVAIQFLFGSEYLPAVGPFRLLLPGVVCMTIVQVLSGYMVGRGHMRTLMASSLIASVVNVVANIVFIPSFGLNAAAVATDASYLLLAGLVARAFAGVTGLRQRDFLVPGRAEIADLLRRGYSGLMRR